MNLANDLAGRDESLKTQWLEHPTGKQKEVMGSIHVNVLPTLRILFEINF